MPRTISRRGKRPRCTVCSVLLHRHGCRRWKCPRCGRTKRLSHRRPGPKPTGPPSVGHAFLSGRQHVRDVAASTGKSYGSAHARIQNALDAIRSSPPPAFEWDWVIPQEHILLADALWLTMDGLRVTVYLVFLRKLHSPTAHLVIAHPRLGWESGDGWRWILRAIPATIREWITTATIDGHSGLHHAIEDLCGLPEEPVSIQWCQFHCLAELQRRLGKKAIKHEAVTKQCWLLARHFLATPESEQRTIWWNLLVVALRLPQCPARTRRAFVWFSGVRERTTTAYERTLHNMPITTGCAEATCKRLRRILRQVRPTSPERVLLACQLLLRLYPTVRCSGWKQKRESHQNS